MVETARKYRYYLKLHNGQLLYGEGRDAAEATRDAGVTLAEVKRHMPVEALLTPEEIAARIARFAALRARQAAAREAQATNAGDVIDTLADEEDKT